MALDIFGESRLWLLCDMVLAFRVGMLACRLDIAIKFNVRLTILSAMLAVVFTFIAFSTAYTGDPLRERSFVRTLSWCIGFMRRCCPIPDPEAGYEALIQDGNDERSRQSDDEGDENEGDTLSSSISSSDSSTLSRPRAASVAGSPTPGMSPQGPSWSESLHAGLSRETRLRIKARARDRAPPEFGWQYWVDAHWKTITPLLLLRAAVWGAAVCLMHYCGMWAMVIPEGRISWNFVLVLLSYAVAFTVCLIACITMEHMEVNFGRQVAFSTIAAFGVCSMHYTGMAAATFYTYSAPAPQGHAGYPAFLPNAIIGIAVSVCVISNVILAHNAISARNRMAEMILTKRRLWRIMAEKEAAEQANELKQQFINIASHEIRTPLHTVNGYCELLARTDLTQEQIMYIASIQQACHAINVIAGNLDRNNVELSARPVLMQLYKVIEDLGRIQPIQAGVDIVVSVAQDVPKIVYLDETYTFRVLMNFCEKGYICVVVTMSRPDELVLQVRDTGCGIPASFHSALFEPFRQADSSITRPRQGTGLGLSIVKHLVQRMSGTVDAESLEGEGTTFTVKLPITRSSYEHTPRPDDAPLLDILADAPKAPPRKRLRIVQSDQRTEALLVELWAQQGYITSSGLPGSTVQDVMQSADAIWADVESVAASALLRELLCMPTGPPFPVFVVHNDLRDLAALEPELSGARNAVFVKRPLILHALREMVDSPEPHMGTHLLKEPPKVRFAVSAEQFENATATVNGKGKEKERNRARPAAQAKDMEEIELIVEPNRRKEKVLLVEDNMVNQRLGTRLLEMLGYDVATADDGQQAIEAVAKSSYYCCLMDCQMPLLDGFSAAEKIRSMEREGMLSGHLPVIALTANVSTESEDRCREAGMDGFLPKPLVLSKLDETLRMHGRPSHL
ncbi:hypothetical protein WOLCODRAFT_87468 [Wolfiporia cocos MD-104 SS10]|uniref:Histidine kinase n=1 Tax=Wolfiporia cocos (strain MD-104) TaxID=742152 RepID=A0A2H3IY54_WOLCO|nr:hypothetical protein WOLCODRAFT_87468 [Wolfiporia cocos MD-104 SS10]